MRSKPAQKSVVRLTDRPDMTLDVLRGRKTTIQQQQQQCKTIDQLVLELKIFKGFYHIRRRSATNPM